MAQGSTDRSRNEVFEYLVGSADETAQPFDGAAGSLIESRRIVSPQVTAGASVPEMESSLVTIFGKGDERERYFRKSVVAPQILRLEKLEQGSDSMLRFVHFWFIAYGNLARLEDDSLTDRMIIDAQHDPDHASDSNDQTTETRQLSIEELQKCHVAVPPPPSESRRESYSRVHMQLFKKLDLDLTMRVVATRDEASILTAAIVDSRFEDSVDLKNTWSRWQRDDAGELKQHSHGAYADAGGYIQFVQLADPSAAILVEGHFAFLEPQDWFDGANLLSSKMPSLVQVSARRLRKSLLKTLDATHDQP